MTYEKAIVKIQEQFVELWNDEFEFNENEWDVDRYMLDEWMFDSCIFDHLPIYCSGWRTSICYIQDNFNIHDTFKMLEYIRESDVFETEDICFDDAVKTIQNFIYCVCREYHSENDYMQYDYYVDASNKIKQWWKKIYWSPKTKVGIKRFNRECEKLGY